MLYTSEKTAPEFLTDSLNSMQNFRQTFGFEPEYDEFSGDTDGPKDFTELAIFSLAPDAIEIKNYDYYIPNIIFANFLKAEIETDKGKFVIMYGFDSDKNGLIRYPELTILLDGQEILNETMEDFANQLRNSYSEDFSDRPDTILLSADDISAVFENSNLKASVLFNSISLSKDSTDSNYFEMSGVYISFK